MNSYNNLRITFTFLIVSLSLPCVVSAQSQYSKRHINAIKTDHAPIIDGDLSDAIWSTASKAEGFVDRQNGNLVSDQTRAYLLYDENYIYVGFECLDSRPETIVGRETVRDTKFQRNNNGNPNNEDNVEVDFDPFLSHQFNDLSQFSVNAIGTRSANLAGGRANKAEWKGDWDAAVKRTPTGWSCEMRIPWNSLNYPTGKKALSMGINFQRFQDRTKLGSLWSNTTSQGFNELEGVWDNVSVPQAKFKPKLSILPYVLTGIQPGVETGKVGVDARYTVTPQLTAVGSFNPDFSTVEGAIQSVQFSHVQHSIPERRPFFLEGGNYFYDQTNVNDIGLFFYPVSIPKFDLGAKLYGKLTAKDTVGFLDTIGFDGRNDFVGRYSHSFNETSSGGAMVVQTERPEGHNTVGVLDDHQRWGKLAFETLAAHSAGPGAGGGAEIISTYYADKFLTSMIQFSGVSNNFLTPDGYIPYTGYKGLTMVEDWSANWRKGPLRSTDFGFVPIQWWQNNGQQYFRGIQGFYSVDTRSDWHIEMDYTDMKFMNESDKTLGMNIVSGASNRFHQVGIQMSTGELGSLKTTSFGPIFALRVFKKLDISYGGYIQNRNGLVQQHILTMNYELSPTRSFGGRIVTQNSDTNAYFFYHNSGGKGTEFYLILGDPNARRTVKSLQAKWVFSFG